MGPAIAEVRREGMAEEPRTIDPTRRLLKTFGVKLTDYEERTAKLLDRASVSERESGSLRTVAMR